eukprot:CAMPEP_0170831286 /NCGR_PEP_ID=MMETSP0733-20121128/49987_1 /TAXON_ID=186038 /ORGANISM="Fragilariopsis kerguelensis, Strain L26-C5" /LENGTH=74 /DNA_ID=CAMNT_0011197053 /DNA_START=423 /DNA_END=645 /DNA_ORIENTATION=+
MHCDTDEDSVFEIRFPSSFSSAFAAAIAGAAVEEYDMLAAALLILLLEGRRFLFRLLLDGNGDGDGDGDNGGGG